MFWNFGNDNKEDNEDRTHQDNFYGRNLGKNGWNNGSYQYCRFCDKNTRFIYDRCDVCKNN